MLPIHNKATPESQRKTQSFHTGLRDFCCQKKNEVWVVILDVASEDIQLQRPTIIKPLDIPNNTDHCAWSPFSIEGADIMVSLDPNTSLRDGDQSVPSEATLVVVVVGLPSIWRSVVIETRGVTFVSIIASTTTSFTCVNEVRIEGQWRFLVFKLCRRDPTTSTVSFLGTPLLFLSAIPKEINPEKDCCSVAENKIISSSFGWLNQGPYLEGPHWEDVIYSVKVLAQSKFRRPKIFLQALRWRCSIPRLSTYTRHNISFTPNSGNRLMAFP